MTKKLPENTKIILKIINEFLILLLQSVIILFIWLFLCYLSNILNISLNYCIYIIIITLIISIIRWSFYFLTKKDDNKLLIASTFASFFLLAFLYFIIVTFRSIILSISIGAIIVYLLYYLVNFCINKISSFYILNSESIIYLNITITSIIYANWGDKFTYFLFDLTSIKSKNISMKPYDKKTIKFIIYSFYFGLFLVYSVLSFNNIDSEKLINTFIKSFATFFAFERIIASDVIKKINWKNALLYIKNEIDPFFGFNDN